MQNFCLQCYSPPLDNLHSDTASSDLEYQNLNTFHSLMQSYTDFNPASRLVTCYLSLPFTTHWTCSLIWISFQWTGVAAAKASDIIVTVMPLAQNVENELTGNK